MICLDSDCIIDFLKGKKEAVEIVEKHKSELVTTEINVFEIFTGIFRKNKFNDEGITKNFFESLDILSSSGFGEKAALIFTDLINDGKEINQNDCMIASILLTNGCNKIITRNVKDFEKIKGLSIIRY